MPDMSGITVAIPSYNHATFVERTLRSVLGQTVRPETLIVIDDGSNDESVKIIGSALEQCPFNYRFIHRENRGLCATLNEALALATSEYFAYISSDDVWLPEFLESRAKHLAGRPSAVLAYGHSYLIDEQDRIFDSTANWGSYSDGEATSMLLRPAIPASASVLYRRDVLKRYGWNESAKLEDYDLYLRLSRAGDFALDDQVLSAWRIHGSNTSSDFPRMVEEWLAAQRRLANDIGLDENELARVQRQVRFNSISSYIRYGHKAQAARLLWENSGGSPVPAVADKILRLLIPSSIMSWRRAAVKRRMIAKYGTL